MEGQREMLLPLQGKGDKAQKPAEKPKVATRPATRQKKAG
jgi:hypothetical protein